ncbi:MAG: HlyD family efflux transporter periplasmic adaptor subunit [Rhizobacter sp.]|nr:HlyD family efflux transporter periplasmic adaptor subunit [Ferruginibacter sp.]
MTKYFSIFLLAGSLLVQSCNSEKVPEVKPVRKDLTEMVFASGVLANDQSNITAQADGYLVKMNFKEGDLVAGGQLLATINNAENDINARSAEQLTNIARSNTQDDAPALQQIAANIEAAKATLSADKLQAERYNRLSQQNSISKQEYETAVLTAAKSQESLKALEEQYNAQKRTARQEVVIQQSERDVKRVTQSQNQVRAMVSGKIYGKKKNQGDYVTRGEVIAVVGNPKQVYAQLNVDETNMSKLKTGLPVIIQLNTNKSKTYKATISEILPTFNIASQSFIIKATFADSLDFGLTGTQLEANIILGEKKNALVIPREYLGYENKVSLKDDKTALVKTGIVSNEWVEISSGLTEKDVMVLDKK